MILSIDDGCASDLRVAEIADKYEVKAIFYLPVEWHSLAFDKGYIPLSYNEALSIARRHEIGSHGYTHRYLTQIPLEEAIYEVFASKIALERLFKKPVTKFCFPRGYTNDDINIAVEQAGYAEARLTRGDNLVHVHPNSGANNNRDWIDVAVEKLEKGIDIECWMHSWELDKYDLWNELEGFLSEHSYR